MNVFSAAFLGIIQGLTEFLPVSSSGHLVILQSLIPDFSQPGILFDVLLHFATTFAVLFYFRGRLIDLVRKYWLLLVVASLPAAFLGLVFRSFIEPLFQSVKLVGLALMVTGVINYLTDKFKDRKESLNIKNSFLVGIFQAIAIIPGISRSGSTIFAGALQGLKKKEAAEFSFLLSMPAILGANLVEIVSHGVEPIRNWPPYLFGFLASFCTGIVSIKLVLKFLTTRKFSLFAVYCFFLGLLVFIWL